MKVVKFTYTVVIDERDVDWVSNQFDNFTANVGIASLGGETKALTDEELNTVRDMVPVEALPPGDQIIEKGRVA